MTNATEYTTKIVKTPKRLKKGKDERRAQRQAKQVRRYAA